MTCCICEKEFSEIGNNALPLRPGICCDKCNSTFVISARVANRQNPKLKFDAETKLSTFISEGFHIHYIGTKFVNLYNDKTKELVLIPNLENL